MLRETSLPCDIDFKPIESQFFSKQLSLLQHMVWDMFGQPDMPNLGERFTKEIEGMAGKEWKQYALDLITMFRKKQLKNYVDLMRAQATILGLDSNKDVDECMEMIEQVGEKATDSPILTDLQAHLQDLFTGEGIEDSLSRI